MCCSRPCGSESRGCPNPPHRRYLNARCLRRPLNETRGVRQSAATALRRYVMTAALIKGADMRIAIITGAVAVLALAAPATAEISGDVVKLGVLNDMSSLYADLSGAGSVEAARMAIADFGGTVNGKKIE